jgi:hypothetical protein
VKLKLVNCAPVSVLAEIGFFAARPAQAPTPSYRSAAKILLFPDCFINGIAALQTARKEADAAQFFF